MDKIENLKETINDLEAQLKDLASKLFNSGYCEYDDLKEYLENVYHHTSWLD